MEAIWQDPNGELRTQPGFMEDRSKSGAGLSVRNEIPPGTRVKLIVNRQEFAAIVRNCRRFAMEYRVGIEYESSNP